MPHIRQGLLLLGGLSCLSVGKCASRLQEGAHQDAHSSPGLMAAYPGWEYWGQHQLPPHAPPAGDGSSEHPLDMQHHTLMFTIEGHIYRKRLDLGGLTKEIMANPNPADFPPFPAQQAGSQGRQPGLQPSASQGLTSQAESSPGSQLEEAFGEHRSAAEGAVAALDRAGAGLGPAERQQLRSLLQSSNGSSDFNPTLACAGCPSSDTRARVNDSTVFPWTAVGMLTRTDQSALSSSIVQCSGTLIGKQHVLTAGHCVVDTDTGSVIANMQFWLAYNGDDEPFQPMTVSKTYVLDQFANQNSVSTSSLNYDFAVVLLSSPMGAGSAQLAIAAGSGERTFNMQTAGYPGDKPQGTLWTVNCPNVNFNFAGYGISECGDACSNMVQHDCLTSQGQSGSGIWDITNTTVYALVTGAFTIGSTNYNVGTEMNPFVYNTVVSWFNESGTETNPYAPVPPSAPVDHHSPSSDVGSWISSHLYVPILPAVIGGIVGLVLLYAIIQCLRRCCCGRRPAKQPVAPGYPAGTYASQYGSYGPQQQHPPQQASGYPPQPQAQPFYGSSAPQQPNSAFAQSFYSSGDPRFWQQQRR